MTTRKYSSRSQQTTLTSSITAGTTTMVVGSASALVPSGLTAGHIFTVVIDPDTAQEEIVDVSVVSTNTLTIARGIENAGTGQIHSAGAVVRHMVTGRDLRESNLHIEATGAYNDGTANHTLHGIDSAEGSVVGTDKAQTLTAKTLTSPIITSPTITAAGVDASIVFEGATADAHETTLTVEEPTADRTITLPNATGTVALVANVLALSGGTMTGAIAMGTSKITGLGDPTSAQDATTKTYVDAILGSSTAAATSATSAATSATSAATSATSASNSATASASSASASASSASAAATSATSAASSATAAATSASSASTSATSAAADAATAAASVATISGYATTASNSAAAASTSATSSATSASAAATSASSAATSATAAATSATSAAASATAAATSATSASVSAASAAAAVTTAIQASIIDAKGDLIVGTAADTAGRLAVGTNGHILTADSAETTGIKWSAAPAGFTAPTIGTTVITSGTTVSTIESVTLNNATLTGTLTAGATSGTNGYLLTATTSGVTWAAAPVSLPSQTGNTGKLLVTDGTTASWAGAAPIASPTEPATLIDGLVWVDTDGSVPGQAVVRWSKAPTGGTTSLSGLDDSSVTLSYTAGYEQVYRNGVLLSRGNDYTATSGNSITLIDATITGDIIEVIGSSVLAIADVYTQAQANSNYIGKALTTTTGDIIYASAANTPARLGIGTTGQVLKVTAGVPAWATPAASGLNYVTGATFSSVSSVDLPTNTFTTTYRNYQIYLDFSSGTGGGELQIRVRKDGTTTSSSIYEYGNVNINRGGTVVGVGGNGDTAWRLGYSNYWDRGANVITVYNPKGSGQKITVTGSVGTGDGVNGQAGGMWQGSISAIDSLNFSISSGTMSGTYRVYGLADA